MARLTVMDEEAEPLLSNDSRSAAPLLSNDSRSAAPKVTSIVAPTWKTIVLATYYTLVVCLGGVQFGLMVAFSSPLLDDFQTHLVPLNFTVWSGFNQCVYQDLIGPIGPAGAVFGSIFSSPVVAVTGFVTGLVVMSSFSVVGWLLMAVSYFTYHGGAWSAVWFSTLLLLGRLLTGVSAGWAAGVVPVYIGEVSPPSVRGKLGALFQMSICVGVLLVYLLGTFLSYWQLAFVCTGASVAQLVLMFTIHESPRLSRNPLKNIRVLLSKRQSNSIQERCSKNTTVNVRAMSQQKTVMGIKCHVLRIVAFAVIMMFQQFVGVSAVASFAGPIFRAARVDKQGVLARLLPSLTVGVVQVVSIFLSLLVVDRFGRRIPLFFGGLGLMVANLGMTVYFTAAFGFVSTAGSGNSSVGHMNASIQNCVSVPLEPSDFASTLSPLPIAGVCLFFVAFSFSWGPVTWVIGGEIFPEQIRELGMGISAAVGWTCSVIVMTAFPVISSAVGQAIPFLVLGVISLLSSIFVVLFLAETKGLPLEEISSMEVVNVRKNVKEFGHLLHWLLRCGFVRKMAVLPSRPNDYMSVQYM